VEPSKATRKIKRIKILKINLLRNRFYRDNIYLLFVSLIILCVSLFTKNDATKNDGKAFAEKIQKQISKAENDFINFSNDTAIINALAENRNPSYKLQNSTVASTFYFFYTSNDSTAKLSFWTTQIVVPDSSIVFSTYNKRMVSFANGYYFVQKTILAGRLLIGLTAIKWNYAITNDYLQNQFTVDNEQAKAFEVSNENINNTIVASDSSFLFSVHANTGYITTTENTLTIGLRILSFLLLLLFIHFAATEILARKGIFNATIFLLCTLVGLRILSYVFATAINFRQFELFNPAIYGSSIVLQSLGDLLINSLLFLWIVSFVKNNIKDAKPLFIIDTVFKKYSLLILVALVLLVVSHITANIIRSLVSDSQISFDVVNVFSISIYSVIGFLVLCSLTIGYFYFCRLLFYLLKLLLTDFILPFFLIIAIAGLAILSFRIGSLSGGFEMYELLWVLIFLWFIKNDLSGYFSAKIIISRMLAWLFFFSLTIAAIIITENSKKELLKRQHYAEVIATKTDPISDNILNAVLTDFRPEVMATNFYLLQDKNTAAVFKDSLINNNFSSFTGNYYETQVLVFDSAENALHNENEISFNAINSILNTQARPMAIADMYYYDAGFDKFNYIAKRIIKEYDGRMLGTIFIVISPRNAASNMLYPELFSRGRSSSLETSVEYPYAIYKNGTLQSSHNDYAFSTRYQDKYFSSNQFVQVNNSDYNELWYSAGLKKYVVIVKENKFWIELMTLFSYLFCAFLLLNILTFFISLLITTRLKISKIKNSIQFTIKQQVHNTIIFFSVFSFIIIGVATILFFIHRYEQNNKEELSRTIKIVETELTISVDSSLLQQTDFENTELISTKQLEESLNKLSKNHGHDINLYSLSGDLKASSLSLPYRKGIVSTKMDPLAFYHLNAGKEIQYFQNEKIGKLDFVSDYIPLTDSLGKEIAYINIPFFTSETKLKDEISTFLVTIINLNAFILLIAGIVALIITNSITSSFSLMSNKMKNINLSKRNETILWERNDEIGDLVSEYNKMVLKLDESAAVLARTERENAWQEMAKQVAHEIKNPLTPMKLSMQYLQKAIDEDAPNVKALSKSVSATLVEQINHLSAIAGEFSRFANIENAHPEKFDIDEALKSVKQLYETDSTASFTWKLIPNAVLVFADKTHVNRILTNLILNGIQAAPADVTPHILIEQLVINKIVLIKITDNGVGISKEIQSKIFTPNFTTKSSGTGLGLAMCKRMAEQAGGDIYFETSDKGTTFFVEFPVV
jgi:two-component system, NtrC family, nitrogen regulation sensor histidine kinase NtrY